MINPPVVIAVTEHSNDLGPETEIATLFPETEHYEYCGAHLHNGTGIRNGRKDTG